MKSYSIESMISGLVSLFIIIFYFIMNIKVNDIVIKILKDQSLLDYHHSPTFHSENSLSKCCGRVNKSCRDSRPKWRMSPSKASEEKGKTFLLQFKGKLKGQ